MARLSPTAEGFRAAFRQPLFTLAEITWRWAVGATAVALFFFGFFEYLDTLPVTGTEMLFLKSRQPFLIWQAMGHILRGSLARGVMSLSLAALLVALLWIITASLARIATLRAILDHVREQIIQKAAPAGGIGARNVPVTDRVDGKNPFSALVRLNSLRVSLMLASLVGFWGATILAGFASSDSHPHPGFVFALLLPLAALIMLAWFSLNWLLSLAAVFVVRDGEDAAGAVSEAVGFCRERMGAVLAVSTWTGLAHLVAFVAATTLVSMPLGLAGLLPWRLVLLAVIVLTLAYLAVADWIHTARLAGYAAIVEMPEEMWAPVIPSIMPPFVAPLQGTPIQTMPLQTTIDRDEPILSDVPNLPTES